MKYLPGSAQPGHMVTTPVDNVNTCPQIIVRSSSGKLRRVVSEEPIV
jgi:hypothetical protein